MHKSLKALLAAGFALAPMAAHAQREPAPQPFQREGQPATLDAPAPPADPSYQIIENFRSAYKGAGSPRMTIFWNRQFSDEADTQSEDYTRYESQSRVSADVSHERFATRDGVAAVGDGTGNAEVRGEIRSGRERLTDTRTASQHAPSDDVEIEQAFGAVLRTAGVNLVDRTMIMRKTGAQAVDKGAVQQIEIEALLANSDIVLEVTQNADSESATGVMYRVIARSIRSARVLIDISTSAQPPSVYRPYVAGKHGFVRAPEAQARPHDIGRQLAIEAINHLFSKIK